MQQPFLLDFDANRNAVLEPDHERSKVNYHFHRKLLFAFITKDAIKQFLIVYPHRLIGQFDCFEGKTPIYEVEIGQEKITFCQAKLGAAAATELLDWLISYGVKQILTIGSAGTLVDLPEGYFLLPTKAIRDEGTSFHYMEASNFVDLNSAYLSRIEFLMKQNGLKAKKVLTWTTDGFFRETAQKVQQFRKLGAACVEMECAAMAACAQFRRVDFAQILFTADSLSSIECHKDRGWGLDAHETALTLAAKIIADV
ncbi:nucleoside phosphorylase [Lactobacillus sp. ESL0228]|uniref:nucleoside phosphorylase n=1 Tax=Lactobacillus sp. ESL0228 TaxID=2069352 RepID=UPI000EFD742E|nr:nucleoside phosphorylase [Lactobacillus sp. ESL0228]RMC48981.1 phosphorylase [Lactobacillus sp. ESL0228]